MYRQSLQSCERTRHQSLVEHCHHYAGFIAHTSSLLFFHFHCFSLLKETHGTKQGIYCLCVFFIIGSKVTRVLELFQQTPKQVVWICPLCLHDSLSMQAFVDMLHDCQYKLQGQFWRQSCGHRSILYALTCLVFRLLALWVGLLQYWCKPFTEMDQVINPAISSTTYYHFISINIHFTYKKNKYKLYFSFRNSDHLRVFTILTWKKCI